MIIFKRVYVLRHLKNVPADIITKKIRGQKKNQKMAYTHKIDFIKL
jgi:hypothetical protein